MREHGLFATPDHMDLAHNQHVAVLSRCLHDSALVTLLGQDKKLHGEVQFGRGLVLQLATLLANRPDYVHRRQVLHRMVLSYLRWRLVLG